MDSFPQDQFGIETRRLLQEDARLAAEVRETEEGLSGLRDIDAILSLAITRLSLCIHFMKRVAAGADPADPADPAGTDPLRATISEKGLSALRLVEGLVAENISEDQKGIIQSNPLFAEVRARMEEFLLAGGAGFLESRQTDARKRRLLSRSVAAALRKYLGEDDRYPPLNLDNYPPLVRRLVLYLFPVMVREHPEQPPYGIEEGQEVTYSSRAMKLPLSQAIFYMENELLPGLESKLAESPGTASLQAEIRRMRERVEDYRKLRFFPRSTPVLLEKGFYTEGMTSYSEDGEMLVPIPLPVTFRSGTNLERKMELVRMDVVRRLAGKGISRELDREYRRLRSLESGTRGSSRVASMKIDAAWGYDILKREHPFLLRLADKEKFQDLVRMVGSSGTGAGERRIESLIETDREEQSLRTPALPG